MSFKYGLTIYAIHLMKMFFKILTIDSSVKIISKANLDRIRNQEKRCLAFNLPVKKVLKDLKIEETEENIK